MLNASRTKIETLLVDFLTENKEVLVYGWIKTARSSKNVSFIQLNDGSTFNNLQLVFDHSVISFDSSSMLTGTCISAKGIVVKSQGKEQSIELLVKEVNIIGTVDEEYPLQKKRHSFEFLRDFTNIRSRTNTYSAVLNVRSKLSHIIHKFFDEKGFKYIHTPLLTKSDCEGAGETFKVTTLDLNKGGNVKDDFFKQPAYLTVSGQLEAEMLALSHGEVYTFGPTFRADPSTTMRHASEFWMVEPEMAFYDLEDLKELIEVFIKYITSNVKCECKEELKFFNKYIEKNLMKRYDIVLKEDFASIEFSEVIKILGKKQNKFKTKVLLDKDLSTEHERYLVDKVFKKPLFITNYPSSFKPFYMRLNEGGDTVACLDLLFPEIGEIIGGSQREERYNMLKQRAAAKKIDGNAYEWYMQSRRWGSAPHSGFGLGLERMIMYLTGMVNIKDVISFPRTVGNIY